MASTEKDQPAGEEGTNWPTGDENNTNNENKENKPKYRNNIDVAGIDTPNELKSILHKIPKATLILVKANISIHSICMLSIFTNILKNAQTNFEVSFINNFNHHIQFSYNDQLINFNSQSACNCIFSNLNPVFILVELAVDLDIDLTQLLWPAALLISFNKFVELSGSKSGSLGCKRCMERIDELDLRIKLCVNDANIMKVELCTNLIFNQTASIYDSIRYGTTTMFGNNLLSKRMIKNNTKINELLAMAGISINQAKECYAAVENKLKTVIKNRFGTTATYVLRNGHDLEIRAVEHVFIIGYYISIGRANDAYFSLAEYKLMDLRAGWEYYKRIMNGFRELVIGLQRAGRGVGLFRGRERDGLGWWNESVLWMVWRLCKKYAEEKGMKGAKIVILVGDGNEVVAYSENVELGRIGMRGEVKQASDKMIVADISMEYRIIRWIIGGKKYK